MTKYTDDHNPFTIEKPNLEDRKKESSHVCDRHADRCPIIVYTDDKTMLEKFEHKELETNEKTKCKFLVPNELTLAQFMTIVRKKISLSKEQALWFYIGKVMPPTSASMGSLYAEHKKEDGFLYVRLIGENVFG